MIRSLITPQTNDLHIALPDDYIGKKVEVLVFTYEDTNISSNSTTDVMAQFWGVVSGETTEAMHKHILQSREEWQKDI